jgi:hypothetical protein
VKVDIVLIIFGWWLIGFITFIAVEKVRKGEVIVMDLFVGCLLGVGGPLTMIAGALILMDSCIPNGFWNKRIL